MALATVDLEKCRRDGLCINVCPMGVLSPDVHAVPQVEEANSDRCIHCGHCVSACPHGAITLDTIGPEQCDPIDPALILSPAQIKQHVKMRRSIRWYQPKPVPRDIILEIIDAARWAPSARNAQPIEWLVIDSPEILHHLVDLVIDTLRPNPGMARHVKAWEEGRDNVLRHAPALVLAHAPETSYDPAVDGTIAQTTFELIANAYHLGTCWAGVFMAGYKKNPAVRAALNLPIGHTVGYALMLGYPKAHYARIPPRRELRVQFVPPTTSHEE